ncbi:putative cyclic nucleotide-gated ion channel 5 [Drosera capensis]
MDISKSIIHSLHLYLKKILKHPKNSSGPRWIWTTEHQQQNHNRPLLRRPVAHPTSHPSSGDPNPGIEHHRLVHHHLHCVHPEVRSNLFWDFGVFNSFDVKLIPWVVEVAHFAPSSRVFGSGELVIDTAQIAKRYHRYFIVDILSVLPLSTDCGLEVYN